MERIGVDPAGAAIMTSKQFHYNLKIAGLTPAQANVLKQDMLSIGGEAAVAKGAASCSVVVSDAIISGTARHFETLIAKLSVQSFGLPAVAESVKEAIVNITRPEYVIKARARKWKLGARSLVMGILNVTPDSFSDGGAYLEADKAVEHGLRMRECGADIVDVGGESTRPNALPVDAEEELKRVIPVVVGLVKKGVAVSVDTSKAVVAKAALDAGAEMIHDVSALGDADMARVCSGAAVVLMHRRGSAAAMQLDTSYKDLLDTVFLYLSERMEYAETAGISRDRIVIDPGIGFGKSVDGNLSLIKNLSEFRALGAPVLVGVSRKSFIGKAAAGRGGTPEERLSGSIAAGVAAVLNGAQILRVHDVKEAVVACAIADALKAAY
ncbi:MAG: dihydropteroate synthase [Deltaproteobacteria bacterium]|nr:dihydropteroate synthase [Deltaproteobacteria bacterium]